MNNGPGASTPASGEDYPRQVREAWTDVIVKAWNDDEYRERLQSDPKGIVEVPRIAESRGKYFPLPKEPPSELRGLSEEELRQRLNEDRARYFGPMMIGGSWADQNDGEAWTEVIIRAWNDENFLNELRSDPKKAIEALGGEISNRIMASEGKYFPITQQPPQDLQISEEELRRKLNEDEPGHFGWMMMCCL